MLLDHTGGQFDGIAAGALGAAGRPPLGGGTVDGFGPDANAVGGGTTDSLRGGLLRGLTGGMLDALGGTGGRPVRAISAVGGAVRFVLGGRTRREGAKRSLDWARGVARRWNWLMWFIPYACPRACAGVSLVATGCKEQQGACRPSRALFHGLAHVREPHFAAPVHETRRPSGRRHPPVHRRPRPGGIDEITFARECDLHDPQGLELESSEEQGEPAVLSSCGMSNVWLQVGETLTMDAGRSATPVSTTRVCCVPISPDSAWA
jgi:hypothetical protein